MSLDFDVDGIPDRIEEQSEIYIVGLDDSARDSDQDGMSNADEFLAGTHPGDRNSFLRIFDHRVLEGRVQFSIPTSEGRQYSVERIASLNLSLWTEIASSLIQGDGKDQIVRFNPPTENMQFYRIKMTSNMAPLP